MSVGIGITSYARPEEGSELMVEAQRVLVVEDDRGVRESLGAVLEHQGHEVALCESGEEALERIDPLPDLVILDLNLPGIDGLETCRRIRARRLRVPILMLTARHEIGDRVAGLDAGADDYLVKPFALDELLARVRALLRRSAVAGASGDEVEVGDLFIDHSTRAVRRGSREIELTKIEFDLLELLVSNRGVVLERGMIHERVWGYAEDLASNSLEVFVSNLRRKTESDGEPRLIHTVRGVGYVARVE